MQHRIYWHSIEMAPESTLTLHTSSQAQSADTHGTEFASVFSMYSRSASLYGMISVGIRQCPFASADSSAAGRSVTTE